MMVVMMCMHVDILHKFANRCTPIKPEAESTNQGVLCSLHAWLMLVTKKIFINIPLEFFVYLFNIEN